MKIPLAFAALGIGVLFVRDSEETPIVYDPEPIKDDPPVSYPDDNLEAYLTAALTLESNGNWRALVYGGEFFNMADHPFNTGEMQARKRPDDNRTTTAAGGFQIVAYWWNKQGGAATFGDFTPAGQRRYIIKQLRDCGALPLIRAGKFREAVERTKFLFESFKVHGTEKVLSIIATELA